MSQQQRHEGLDVLLAAAVGLAWLVFQLLVHAVTLAIVLASYRRPWRSSKRAYRVRKPDFANQLRPIQHPLHQIVEKLQGLSRTELQHLVHRPGRLRKDQLIGTICTC